MLQTDPLANSSSPEKLLAGAPLHSGHSRHYEPGDSDATPAGSLSALEPRSPRSGASECTVCPPWVLRCAHWEGQTLWLFDGTQFPYSDSHFRVGLLTVLGTLGECSHCSRHPILRDPSHRESHHDLPAAEAEFTKREEEWKRSRDAAALLGRAE